MATENNETSMKEPLKILAVVVTYNRSELLSRCLSSILGQTIPLTAIVVVNNASTDDTEDVLARRFPQVKVLTNEQNLGGAGGWARAISEANQEEWDFLWLLDDDAWAEPNTLEVLIQSRPQIKPPPSFLCSRVIDQFGGTVNLPHAWLFNPSHTDWDRYLAKGFLPIKAGSFVSMLIPGELARKTRPPLGHYFLWLDDYEYSLRLAEEGPGWYVSTSIVNHPRAGGLAAPDLVLEQNPNRLRFYVHYFSNYIETISRHPKHHPHWFIETLQLGGMNLLRLVRNKKSKRIKIVIHGMALGYFRAFKFKFNGWVNATTSDKKVK